MTPYCPLFLSLEGRGIVVIVGCAVAARRIEKLLPFQPNIMVVSPELHPSLLLLAEQEKITWECREYRSGDCSGAFLVLAATDDPQVNKRAGEEARDAGRLRLLFSRLGTDRPVGGGCYRRWHKSPLGKSGRRTDYTALEGGTT